MQPSVTFVTQFFDPDPSATSCYLSDIAYGLVERGLSVSVITAQPSYERGLPICPALERKNGVLIHRVEVPDYDKSATFRRGLAQLKFTLSAAAVLKNQSEKSLVVTVTCPPFLVWLGYLCTALGRPFVPLIHDVYPQIAVVLGRFPEIAAPLWEALDRGALASSKAVWVLGRCQASIMAPRLPARLRGRIQTIPHWASAQIEDAPGHHRRNHPLLQSIGIEGKFVVQYSGNLGLFHGLDILPDLIERTDAERVHFLIVGGGQMRDWLEQETARRGLEHVTFLPRQSDSEFPSALSACDAALVCLHPNATGLCVPSKLYGHLASGRPVIAVTASDAETARVVREHECGIVVDSNRPEDVALAISELSESPERLARLGRNAARAYRAQFTKKHGLDAYEAALRRLVHTGPRYPTVSRES